jgi:hypothetical protein
MSVTTMVLLQVVVKTSDVKGAGTDANVHITLFGEQVCTMSGWLHCTLHKGIM